MTLCRYSDTEMMFIFSLNDEVDDNIYRSFKNDHSGDVDEVYTGIFMNIVNMKPGDLVGTTVLGTGLGLTVNRGMVIEVNVDQHYVTILWSDAN